MGEVARLARVGAQVRVGVGLGVRVRVRAKATLRVGLRIRLGVGARLRARIPSGSDGAHESGASAIAATCTAASPAGVRASTSGPPGLPTW